MYEPSTTSCVTANAKMEPVKKMDTPIDPEISRFVNDATDKLFNQFSISDVLTAIQQLREMVNRSIINQALQLENESTDRAQTAKNYRSIADQI